MAIAFRSATTAGNASGGNLTINKPTGTADGDILIAVCYREAGTWTPPAGWSLIRDEAQGTTIYVSMYWKRASGDGSSYTFNLSTTTWRTMAMAAFSGCLASGDPVEVSTGTNSSSGYTTLASVTTSTDNDMLIGGTGNYDGNNLTLRTGSGITRAASGYLAGTEIWYKTITPAGATGTFDFNPSSQRYATVTAALKPAASATNATINAELATASAAAPLPTITATSNATIAGELATAGAAAIAPTIATGSSATISGEIAQASAEAIAPAITAISHATIAGEIGAASAAAPAASVTTSAHATIAGEIGTASAAGIAPTVSGSSHQIYIGNGFTDVTPRVMVRTSDDRVWISTWKFDVYPHGGIGSSPYNSQTLRMYKANQTGTPASFTRMDSANEHAGVTSWAMAVDQFDVIHVVWMVRTAWSSDGTDNYVRYAQFDTANGTWGSATDIETTAGTHEMGQGDELIAIAIDRDNVPHIVYLKHDGTRRRVTYRNRAGGSWGSATTVDDQSFGSQEQCWHPGIAFDDAGRIVVTWMRGAQDSTTAGRCFVRVYSGGSWGTTVDVTGANLWTGIDTGTPLYIDASGRYHLCFLNTSKQIQYRYSDNQGASWSSNNPGSGTYTGDDPTPAPGPNGKVRVYAHSSDASPHIIYFEGDGGSASWSSATNYITQTPYDCSVSVRWARYFWFYPSRLDIAYWKNSYSPDTNELYFGADVAGADALVMDAAKAASAAGLAATITTGADITIAGVAGAASAAAPAASITTSSNATIAGEIGVCAAAALNPAISTTGSATIVGEVGTAAAAALAPMITVTSSASVAGETASASAAAPAASITTTSSATIAGEMGTASAAAIAPVIATGASAIVSSEIAPAAAAALAPVITVTAFVSIAGEIGTATAAALVPTVTAISDSTVAGTIGTASAAALEPAITTASHATISGQIGTATASAWPAVITTTSSATIAGVAGWADANLLIPQLFTVDIARDIVVFALAIDTTRPITAGIELERAIEAGVERESVFTLEF